MISVATEMQTRGSFSLLSNNKIFSTVSNNNYLLTPWGRVLLEKLTGLQLVKKFPTFHGTQRFITVLTSVRHLSLSWASPIQSIYLRPTSWRSVLILSTHLRLGPSSGLFPSGFPTKTLYASLSLPIRATCPAHLILLDFITRTILGEEYKSFSSSLCNLYYWHYRFKSLSVVCKERIPVQKKVKEIFEKILPLLAYSSYFHVSCI